MRRNNVTKKHYVLAFVGLMLAAPLAAKNHLPSEKVFPKRSNIYKKGWIDLNKNGKKDVYEDPTQEIQKRINDLIGRMTIEEKAGQLVTYYGYKKVMGDSIPTEKWKNSVLQHGVANIDEHLKGEYNPGGKLTGTWPKTVGQLPMNVPTKPNANMEPLKYHSVANKGLLYCFGHGLSYTSFAYSDLAIDSIQTQTGRVNVTCKVTNTGSVAGDEVVQLYINDVVSSTTTYEKNLRGFERIHLQPGETQSVTFAIKPDDLILIDRDHRRVVEAGEFRVMVGASYEDIRLNGVSTYGQMPYPKARSHKRQKRLCTTLTSADPDTGYDKISPEQKKSFSRLNAIIRKLFVTFAQGKRHLYDLERYQLYGAGNQLRHPSITFALYTCCADNG